MVGVLGDAAIKAAQALSEKFGIPTFNLYGGIQTIPQTRPSDPTINVGSGSTGLNIQSFNALISALSPQQALVPTRPVFSPSSGFTIQPIDAKLVKGEIPINQQTTPTNTSDFLQKYQGPLILAGVGIAALVVLSKV